MTRFFYYIFIIIAFISCGVDKVPSDFPDKHEFAQILADIHLTEALEVNKSLGVDDPKDSIANGMYHDVLLTYGLTQGKFDTIVNWYLNHIKIYQQVYEEVEGILTERQLLFQDSLNNLTKIKQKINDLHFAANVWNKKREIYIKSKDSFDKRIPFFIPLDTIEANKYDISLDYYIYEKSKIKKAKFELIGTYADSTRDTLLYDINVKSHYENLKLVFNVDSTKKLVNFRGFLMNYDTLKRIDAKINKINFEHNYPNDTIFEYEAFLNEELS